MLAFTMLVQKANGTRHTHSHKIKQTVNTDTLCYATIFALN